MLTLCATCNNSVEIPERRPPLPFTIIATKCPNCGSLVGALVRPRGSAKPTGRRAFPCLPPFP